MQRVEMTVTYTRTDAGWVGVAVIDYVDQGKRETGETPAFPSVQALREYLDTMMENFIETISLREPTLVERTYSAA